MFLARRMIVYHPSKDSTNITCGFSLSWSVVEDIKGDAGYGVTLIYRFLAISLSDPVIGIGVSSSAIFVTERACALVANDKPR